MEENKDFFYLKSEKKNFLFVLKKLCPNCVYVKREKKLKAMKIAHSFM